MFPAPKLLVEDLEYKNIDRYRSFKDANEKSKYIDLMRIEIREANKLSLVEASNRLYKLKYEKPNDRVSMRCFDFKQLETGAAKYMSLCDWGMREAFGRLLKELNGLSKRVSSKNVVPN